MVLGVPFFMRSFHKSTKQYGFSFGYDAPNVWNELPDDICSATSRLFLGKTES